MKKIFRSSITKTIASILMSVSIIVFVASACVAFITYSVYRNTGKSSKQIADGFKKDEMQSIINNYYRELIIDYQEELDGYEKWDKVKYIYDESACNMAFRLEPAKNSNPNLPVFANYEIPEDMIGYTYTRTETVNSSKNSKKKVFTYSVDDYVVYNCTRNDILFIEEHYGNGEKYYLYKLEKGETDDSNVHTYVVEDGQNDLNISLEAGAAHGYYDATEANYELTVEYYVADDNYEIMEFDLSESTFPYAEIYYDFYYGLRPEYNLFDISDNEWNVYAYAGSANEKGNYVVSNGIHSFYDNNTQKYVYLDKDNDFCEQYNNFFGEIEKEYSYWHCKERYDEATRTYIVEVWCNEAFEVSFTAYVKKPSNFTANDVFSASPVIRYAEDIIYGYKPGLIISVIFLILITIYIIASAGWVNKTDELYISTFDKIPYEFCLLPFPLLVYNLLYLLWYNRHSIFFNKADVYIIILLLGVVATYVPIFLFTTATRIKAKTIFKNTIIYKAVALTYKCLKKCSKKASGIFRTLWKNFNLYGKVLGIFMAFALGEFILIVYCMNDGSPYSMPYLLLLWLIEKILFATVLVIACLNMDRIKKAEKEIVKGNLDYEVDTAKMLGEFKEHGENLNSIRNGMSKAVEESLKSERMKTELITNVSHDIKTPLTSIINYVDLLKKEDIENEKAGEYIEVLDRQSAKLKKLIQDLIDASKASTGNIDVNLEKTDLNIVINQALGEFQDKLEARNIRPVIKNVVEDCFVIADGRLLWRVMENIINNIVKYAQENSRAYIDVTRQDENVSVTFKNISKDELNISGDELVERFVRGDSSRNTEGSGLGLSIAKSLIELQNGKMEIIVDGDLFKVVLLLIVG